MTGSYPSILVTVNVASDAPASITNTATLSHAPDLNLANNTASVTHAVSGLPDMTITKSHTGDFVQGQVGAIYSIVARNSGASPTTGPVTVTDTLPAGMTATAISGGGWSCTLATLICTRADALAASSNYPTIFLTVTVGTATPAVALSASSTTPTLGSSVTLTATLTGGVSPSGTVTFKDGAATIGTALAAVGQLRLLVNIDERLVEVRLRKIRVYSAQLHLNRIG